jgi:hypothetical protein
VNSLSFFVFELGFGSFLVLRFLSTALSHMRGLYILMELLKGTGDIGFPFKGISIQQGTLLWAFLVLIKM